MEFVDTLALMATLPTPPAQPNLYALFLDSDRSALAFTGPLVSVLGRELHSRHAGGYAVPRACFVADRSHRGVLYPLARISLQLDYGFAAFDDACGVAFVTALLEGDSMQFMLGGIWTGA